MLNPIGLLLRDVFTGFSEAPVAIFSKRNKNKYTTEKKNILDF